MNGWTGERWMDKQVKDDWMGKWVSGHFDKLVTECFIVGWMDSWVDKQTNGWKWIDG
jgi:hypothetical protein